jgi:heme-degrading monooxygenase HmoA
VIAVIFEVEPHPEARQAYLDIAASLGGDLAAMDGFVSIERYASLTHPDRILSLSFWRDEDAVAGWRKRSSCATTACTTATPRRPTPGRCTADRRLKPPAPGGSRTARPASPNG